MSTADLETSLARELEPILGEQPSEIAMQQSLQRVTYDPATRQVCVSLRDGSRFVYTVPDRCRPSLKPEHSKCPAVSRAMALAISYQRLAEERNIRTYEELAKLARLTRPRVSQILLLTNLAPVIQEALLFLPRTRNGPERLTEEQLRSIAQVIDWREQIQRFRSLWDASSAALRQAAIACRPAWPSARNSCSKT